MVNSGTEATMSAIRRRAAVTGRDKLIKFEGCIRSRGHLLVKAGSGVATLGCLTVPAFPPHLLRTPLHAIQ